MARRIMVLSNGLAGSEVQALGLAQRCLAICSVDTNSTPKHIAQPSPTFTTTPPNITVVNIPPTKIVRHLPTVVHHFLATVTNNVYFGYNRVLVEAALNRHKPDLIIGCGRSTGMLNRGIKQKNPFLTTVQVLNPYLNPTNFDFVVLPKHDANYCLSFSTLCAAISSTVTATFSSVAAAVVSALGASSTVAVAGTTTGALSSGTTTSIALVRPKATKIINETHNNVLWMTGSIHDKSRKRLMHGKKSFQNTVGVLPYPRVAILLGAPHARHCPYDNVQLMNALEQVVQYVEKLDGSIMALGSRRTPSSSMNQFKDLLKNVGLSHVCWSPGDKGKNPYLGALATADAVFVTPDSMTMTCEALSSNPNHGVHVLMSDVPQGKFYRFFNTLWSRNGRSKTNKDALDTVLQHEKAIDFTSASTCTKRLVSSKQGDDDLEKIAGVVAEAVRLAYKRREESTRTT